MRLVALENQCTGAPAYAGEQDDDPANDTDCKAGSDADLSVRAAELAGVLSVLSSTTRPGVPRGRDLRLRDARTSQVWGAWSDASQSWT